MKRKNRLIALVVMLVLMVQMTGCGGAEASGSENVINTWAGYEADAANGLRVKSVEFRTSDSEKVSKVEYDMEGNITSASIYHGDYEPFLEKVSGISVMFEYTLESLAYSEYYERGREGVCPFLLKKTRRIVYGYTLEADGRYVLEGTESGIRYYFLADGRVVQDGKDKYKYDDIGRLIEFSRESEFQHEDGTTYRSVDTFRYTYVEDSLYIASRVHSHDGNFSALGFGDFWKITYEYDYDDNHNIVRVKEYYVTDEMQINGSLHAVWEYEYDENGNVVCVTKVVGSDHGDITTRYQYDSDGNLIEECEYQTFGSEEYITSKMEYQYDIEQKYIDANDNKEHVRIDDLQRKTEYKYEANSDYSIVNLIDTVEGDWQFFLYRSSYNYNYKTNNLDLHEGYDEVNDCWTVTYYTQEEIDQYMHDQEFQRIN